MSEHETPDGGGSTPDGGQGDPGSGGSVSTPPASETVHRSHLEKVMTERDRAKTRARESESQLQALREAAGGNLTVEQIADYKKYQDEKAAAERAAKEKKGEYETIIQKERAEHEAAQKRKEAEKAEVMNHLRREKLGRLATDQLVTAGVLDDALEAARDRMIENGVDGVKLELVLEGGEYVPQLRDKAGVWPSNGEDGAPMTVDQFRDRFKAKNTFLFKSSVAPGAGGAGTSATRAGGVTSSEPTTLEAAIEGGIEAFAKATGQEVERR